MSTLRIYLFGKFCVRRNEQVLDGFDARKVQELFCYLLLHRDHSLPRKTLASLLWPDTTTVQCISSDGNERYFQAFFDPMGNKTIVTLKNEQIMNIVIYLLALPKKAEITL